jgi:hypothetical protein
MFDEKQAIEAASHDKCKGKKSPVRTTGVFRPQGEVLHFPSTPAIIPAGPGLFFGS